MGNELVRCAVAANRDVPSFAPGPYQDCREEIHIGIFFDGTGNNRGADGTEKKWSNVARLFESAYRAAQLNKNAKVYAIYISGLGTKFNGNVNGWLQKAEVWVEDNVGGGGVGYGGDRRMEMGTDLVNDYLRTAMISSAQRLGGVAAKYAEENCDKSFGDISSILHKYRLIKTINISIFGFSRGAALARAFANRLVKCCTPSEGRLLYEGNPLRINFMGLFDTVASFGIPSQNARTPFTERELIVPSVVERCVHFVAAHELRFSFPVDLIRKDGKLAGDWVEKVFPGVHSDVGGGYAPMEQGIDNGYARIPLREMLGEALRSGARLIGYADLSRLHTHLFHERFECTAPVEAAYARYMAACAVTSGTIEQQIIAHMKLFYSANGTMNRSLVATTRDRSLAASKIKSFLGPRGMAAEVAACRTSSKNIKLVRFGGASSRSYAQYVKIQEWQLAAWDATATDGVVEFISRYVHDSKVDFLFNAEPFSYFSARGVAESNISVWQETGNWLANKGRKIKDAGLQALNSGEEKLKEIGVATNRAKNEVSNSIHRTIGQATDFARSTTEASAKVASRVYSAVTDAGEQAIASGEETVSEMGKNVERIYESGTDWVRRRFP